MNPCHCGSRNEHPVFIGLQRGLDDQVALALYNCACGTTKAIRWTETTQAQRAAAIDAELARLAAGGMV